MGQRSKTVAALRQGLDEITESRDHAIKSGSTLQSRLRDMEKDLKKALDNRKSNTMIEANSKWTWLEKTT
jgi:uncharacterized protein YaaN involved in tellurite resistance